MIELTILTYLTVAALSAVVLFVIFYFLVIDEYGALLGGTIGIIPAAIMSICLAIIWPIALPMVLFK